ncbi:MAG: family 78 glycoside hydrolase catalytic domain [Clostridia bacterium]|nr:family 78 glycoside hydrolase catalytic domain [Clostridia bacterium]
MLKITGISLDGALLRDAGRYRITSKLKPRFGWRAESDRGDNAAVSARVCVQSLDGLIWNSGPVAVKSALPFVTYTGPELPLFTELYVSLEITDAYGEIAEAEDWFYSYTAEPDFGWICAPDTKKRRPVVFKKRFALEELPAKALALYCGIGYSEMFVNGVRVDNARLDPAFTDYTKRCDFVFQEGFERLLRKGDNELAFVVADGWRNFDSTYLLGVGIPRPRFDGPNLLSARIVLEGKAGRTQIDTDDSWIWSYNNTIETSIYDGEICDARISLFEEKPVQKASKPCEKAEIMTIPPIVVREMYRPVDVLSTADGVILDFGQNLAGVVRLPLPSNLTRGQTMCLKFAELLDDDFTLFTAPLREAKATDTYIAAGDGNDPEWWEPRFTYHGFRYCQISGCGEYLDADKVFALAFYTDLSQTGDFRCGSPALNAIHKACVQTEKANIHSILTDCPQRDERMGWMNDATVRFEETPYNFSIDRIFPKVVDDLCDVQDAQGGIRCTAPFIVGGNPADPVCSSFLVAGYEYFRRSGDTAFVAAHYDNWRRWEECLLAHSDDYIVNYSYYGDWAGPQGSCLAPENAYSAVTPGSLMSTGYSYFNCLKLAEFAAALGLTGDVGKWLNTARAIARAYCDKWLDRATGKVATGSQGCQVFSLWLGILPAECRKAAFDRLVDALEAADMHFTTGNLNTRYLFDILAEYGRVDLAYRLLRDEDYPGYGYMLENGATTIWERFELKKDPSMNSHDHPMYASIDRWFYAYLLGIQAPRAGIGGSGCSGLIGGGDDNVYTVKPYFPAGLLSAQGYADTPYGRLAVRWKTTYGQTRLSVSVPFGMKCRIVFGGAEEVVGSGEYVKSGVVEGDNEGH